MGIKEKDNKMTDFKKNKRKEKNKKKKGNKHNHHELMFSQALEGYQLHAEARKLSYHTLQDYFRTFNRFYTFLGEDIPINSITANNIEQFIASLTGLSKKTICNYHTGLSALWTWAVNNEFVHKHVVRAVIPPKPTQKESSPEIIKNQFRILIPI